MSNNILLIFTRNLIYGKVKTRLAASIGHDYALSVYRLLLEHTAQLTKNIDATRIVYYSDAITDGDAWDNSYLKTVQQGGDLGERMANAFDDNLKNGTKKVVIIGTDCYELNSGIIADAFSQLDHHDVVIGPALDGGYYLLGMKAFHPELFYNVAWSTPSVLKETLSCCDDLSLTYFRLPVLSDIDEEKDLARTDLLSKL
ncbi:MULTISPECIES: TIGR04282 family arsenosugar biosynthesis glycosyltransferase [unclassified Mucilaginibacter]|uniref:TIGR04282 family arsenosugar biosynthesis glycosyltransferase n=1 Tax=unclassified Mucilaginibacter TaxID=2617802 RepID=UPI002AC8D934|nr:MULTISPECIES: TIGR04282 family arsenosugar biosynthesis glycosyltransferase [unclassified Mucilaginibacter]MEB0260282.1 TIGR04282 family arsenosugar biosynthesis glycosyltransferase [Mucilaginibacter sp. 10I4]MEB0277307.1 TIGR04282 family arsenosugar biosynthesis glycosyltransferase [Mucilaginibacter sp. 10B2]MEB0302158.1 TIGR04282 family arsenosugar biosynthesis glycosyltransferase [Mucilaginibacter sp. 5C4]WPX25433.1 TIGR04282 family arsenosugar biosynthesis glycosyltransferase [Mucilagini